MQKHNYETINYYKRRTQKLQRTMLIYSVFALVGFIWTLDVALDSISRIDWFTPKTVEILNTVEAETLNADNDFLVQAGELESVSVGEETNKILPASAEIVKKIIILESSGGKNNYSKCQEQGLYNRYGYGIPGDGTYRCFEKDEDTKAVEKWFDEKLNEMDIATATCYYNTGTKTQDCPYYQNFINI